MALPALSPEQRQEALAKAREARAARSALLAGLKAGTLTLADVLGRDDDLAPQDEGRPGYPRAARRRQDPRRCDHGARRDPRPAPRRRSRRPSARTAPGAVRRRVTLPLLEAISACVRAESPAGTCAPSRGRRWPATRQPCFPAAHGARSAAKSCVSQAQARGRTLQTIRWRRTGGPGYGRAVTGQQHRGDLRPPEVTAG